MNQKDESKKLIKLRKTYFKYKKKIRKLKEKIIRLENKNNCLKCSYYMKNKTLPLEEQFMNKQCDKTKELKKVSEKLKRLSDNFKIFLLTEYSRFIFDIFKEQKPKIYVHRYKDVFDWNEVFVENFFAMSDESKIALVNLIENNECEYSLAGDKYYFKKY